MPESTLTRPGSAAERRQTLVASGGDAPPNDDRPLRGRSSRRRFGRWLRTGVIAIGAMLMLFPFLWMLSTSLTGQGQLFADPSLIPDPIDTSAYSRVADAFPLWRWLANSIGVAVVSTVLQVLTSAMAAYVFARFEFRGKQTLFVVYLATLMIPLQVLIVPLFIEISRLGLVDTYTALILPLIASPFGVFLLRQAFLTLPREVEEAARIDGANHWQIFTRIVMPLSKPALATLTIFAFMASWNSFLWPLIAINSEAMMTLPLGLSQLHGRFATEWNLVMAGSTISVVPIVAVYLFAQRYVIQGVANAGLKG